jgi:hypothetical protein
MSIRADEADDAGLVHGHRQVRPSQNGKPLLNQTFGLHAAIVKKALGDRWTAFADERKTLDPDGRLLNDYFRGLLA